MAPQADQLVWIPQMGAGNFKLSLLINFKLSNKTINFQTNNLLWYQFDPLHNVGKVPKQCFDGTG